MYSVMLSQLDTIGIGFVWMCGSDWVVDRIQTMFVLEIPYSLVTAFCSFFQCRGNIVVEGFVWAGSLRCPIALLMYSSLYSTTMVEPLSTSCVGL